MKRTSTLFLRCVILVMAIIALILCGLALSEIPNEDDFDYIVILSVMNIAALPFFFALFQTLKLLNYIDKNKAFSDLSVKAIKNIKYSAISMSLIYALAMPFVYHRADVDDAPGLIILGLGFVFAPTVIATFAAVLERILKDALSIKSENDLTV